MNKPKRASKSSEEIINEIFDTLHLPVTEEHSKKSKVSSSNKGYSSDISRDSPNDLSGSDSSSSSDQEIDKLLEEITEVTDKDIKIDEADFVLAQKDKKKKKKKVKKSNGTKIKHKKRKKKKSSKIRNSPDSELDAEKSKEDKLRKSFSSEAIKDRSHSPDLGKTSYNKKSKPKSVYSRSRSKSLSKKGSRSRSRSRSRYTRSRSRSRSKYLVSRSKSRSYYNNNTSQSRYNRSRSSSHSDIDYNSKRSKSRRRAPSRSPSYSPPKSRKRETKSRSPVKRKDKEPLDSWKSTKLTTQKKSNTPPKPDSADSKPKEIQSKSEESTKSSTLTSSETNSDLKISESVKISISDKNMTKESNSQPASKVDGNSADNKTPDISAKGQEKLKDEGKGKMIVIKNLKESSVLQQAEEAQSKSKDNVNPAENNAPLVFDVKKEEISEKPVKEEKTEPENLLTAFKKTKKEKEEADKKDVKKGSKSRSRSRSLVRSSRRSRSRSRGAVNKPYGKRKRSRSTSRSRKRRSKSRERYKKRSRSRSRSKRSASRDRYRGGKRSRSGSRSKEFNKSRGGKSSSSKDKRKSPDCVDSLRDKATRKRLLEIARKNAVYLMKNNCLPPSIEKESVLRATGKSIEELTSFCKQLVSKGDYSDAELSDPSLSPEEHESFSSSVHHHPFAVKDKPIMMNIRNAPMLPTKTNAERLADASKLREQFPVSSGSHHRTVAESDWVPVEKDDSKGGRSDKVFPDDCSRDIDISNLVSTRLNAMRRLQDNPTDKEAMKILSSAQKDMQNWALSKQVPGQFTGSTGARILSAEELSSGYQAWAKKGQFSNASPVTSQFGMKILQKMGWNPGEGLGKNKEGGLIPLIIDVKMDKKGLSAAHEIAPRRQPIPLAKTLQGKHPVSALIELCSKRKWSPPEWEIVFDTGPDHKKNYLIQVHVNNQTFKTSCAATTKKIAKANAAAACLQALGLIPGDGAAPVKSQETLNTTGQLAAADPDSTSTVTAPVTEDSSGGDSAQATEASHKGTPQMNLRSNYNAATNNESVSQYSTDNSQTSAATPYVSDGTMANYINDTSQTANQYDSSAMSQYQSHYTSDGGQGTAQYGDNQAMGAYSAEAMAQYSTNGTQDMSHYQGNSTEAMAQYSSTDPQAQYSADPQAQYSSSDPQAPYSSTDPQAPYSSTDTQAPYSSTDPQAQYSSSDPQAMTQYSQSAVGQYSSDGSQTSLAQYSQAYQQYSAEAIQAYQQQYSSSNSQSQSGSFTFPQPPRSLTHGITLEGGGGGSSGGPTTDNGSGNHGSRGDSSASNDSRSHSGSGSQSHSYKNGNNSYGGGGGYSSNSSSTYNQTQYYDGSYQGSQY